MEIYNNFAQLYDLFMSDVPYDDWVIYIETLLIKYGEKPSLVLELACGTGNITTRLAAKGYDIIGVDSSEDMLAVAKEKNNDILYLHQDMREFELYGTVDCVLCLCDGLNYILEEQELLEVFSLVKNYLNPGGLFVFDLNTQYKFETVLADNTFAQTTDKAAFIWENYCHHENGQLINEYAVTFFSAASDKNSNETLFKRYEETHYQRAYSADEIKRLVEQAGLTILGVFGENSLEPPSDTSERIYFVVRH